MTDALAAHLLELGGRIQTGTDLVLAVSGDGNALRTFHPSTDLKNGKVTTIALDGAPKFLAADGSGKGYIPIHARPPSGRSPESLTFSWCAGQ